MRMAFLSQTCQGNTEMRERIEELLAVQSEADEFFEGNEMLHSDRGARSPGREIGEHESIGARIGPYRLVQRLGEGGCGIVYLAEQEEPIRRRVALKIIRVGFDSDYAMARFEIERQALALMDHPNIARVLDVGTTASGRPYLAMEMVAGKLITEYCDEARLELEERLQLFIQVCFAVQHAHQKGIIHRDLKPANVMVSQHDGIAVPKVIDFGVAKATAGNLSPPSGSTTMNRLIGTPSYMSPEQAEGSGLDVDTRSDIYSLGVLLFELLAGFLPWDPESLRKAGANEIRRMPCNWEDAPLPSTLFASLPLDVARDVAVKRGTDRRKLINRLRGDLDGIVMKAMERDRQQRYGTANGLALDIQRYLNCEPVLARAPGRTHRLRMLVRRNKLVFASGTVAVVALVVGLGTSTWLYIRERAAWQEQVRLKDAAERARAVEVALRERAEVAQRVARAAVNVQAGLFQEADQLVATIPLEQVPSTLEAANTFRRLGEWHLESGRLKQAADRYGALSRAITRADRSDNTSVSFELVAVATVLCKINDAERYEEFRRMMIERFAGTAKASVASQVIKACLLRSADEKTIAALLPLGTVTEEDLPKDGQGDGPPIQAWRTFAVALMRYRQGDLAAASRWARRCLAHPDKNPSRNASARFVLAMAEARAGHRESAQAELLAASQPVREWLGGPFQQGNPQTGYWFDWIIASVLMEEAAVEVDAPHI